MPSISQHLRAPLGALLCALVMSAPGGAAGATAPAAQAVSIELPDLNGTERAWAEDPASIPGPLRLGFGRAVSTESALAAQAPGNWHRTQDGSHVLALRLRSPGALGLRIALNVVALPDAALLGFFGAAGHPAAVLSGVELKRGGGAFWSPLLEGDAAFLALALPAGTNPAALHLRMPQISHLVRWPFAEPAEPEAADNPCRLDVACQPAWQEVSRATVLLVYTDKVGGTGTCTGTLLRDGDTTSAIPYIITAQHCAPDQDRAASIEAVWFHGSADCDGADDPAIQSVSGGADLLQSNAVTDISLLRLRRPAPTGAVFAPWSPHLPEPGTQLVSVHHPEGRRQAIAFGQRTGLLACADVPLCEDDGATAEAHYLEVTWHRGGTAIGSSGAGLFLASGELVGVLSGGYGDCQGKQRADHYGRFDLSYRGGLVRWLGRQSRGLRKR